MKKTLLLSLAAFCTFSGFAQKASYECDFEDAAQHAAWKFFDQADASNKWKIGTAVRTYGQYALYVTPDDGLTADYEHIAGTVSAYVDLPLPRGRYYISFEWQGWGIDNYKAKPTDQGLSDEMGVSIVNKNDESKLKNSPFGQWPSWISGNTDIASTRLFGTTKFNNRNAWRTQTELIEITDYEGDNPLLAFCWKIAASRDTVSAPGACIDNIQIVPAEECYLAPSRLKTANEPDGIRLTWEGAATEYEVQYRSLYDSTDTEFIRKTVTRKEAFFAFTELKDGQGAYEFRVRPICDGIAGLWSTTPVTIAYDPTTKCMDYMNLYADGVVCQYGLHKQDNPDVITDPNTGVVDDGYRSRLSLHTLHYQRKGVDDTDPRTNNGQDEPLHIIPDGELAVVRIGGRWGMSVDDGGGVAQSITYKWVVPEDVGVLELNYAIVAQSGKHDAVEQPRFRLELLSEDGQPLDPNLDENGRGVCSSVDFRPPSDIEAADIGGWKRGYTNDVFWRDWNTMAINVQDYRGQTILIKLSNFGCVHFMHWAYAYFTLSCNSGNFTGMECDQHTEYLVAPEGFKYKWEKLSADGSGTAVNDWYTGTDSEGNEINQVDLRTSNKMFIKPGDDRTYRCNISLNEEGKESCSYYLEAVGVPQSPKPQFTFRPDPDNCQEPDGNALQLTNTSGVYLIKDGTEKRTGDCDNYEWDFGEYGTSTQVNPRITGLPIEGTTMTITLTAWWGACSKTETFTIEVPPARFEHKTYKHICAPGEQITFEGVTFTANKDTTVTKVYASYSNCDSVRTMDLVIGEEIICKGGSYDFYGTPLDVPDTYHYNGPDPAGVYDSIAHTLCLVVQDTIGMNLAPTVNDVCNTTSKSIIIPYDITEGSISNYDLSFDETAKAQGFVDQTAVAIDSKKGDIVVPVPDTALPGWYTAHIVFHNDVNCGDKVYDLPLEVYYPADVITHRWNDVLAVKKPEWIANVQNGIHASEYYTFHAFQWYKDGKAIPDATLSYYTTLPDKLDATDKYYVRLTRTKDNAAIRTCDAIIALNDDDYVEVELQTSYSSQTSSKMPLRIRSNHPIEGEARVVNMFGQTVSMTALQEYETGLPVPETSGMYVVEITLKQPDGNLSRHIKRVIVQ